MTIGILKEPDFEKRVSLIPEAVAQVVKKGMKVIVESGAGLNAAAKDIDYEKAGAQVASAPEVVASADVILCINHPLTDIANGKVLIGVYQPLYNTDLVNKMASNGLTVFSLDMLPRTTRAQSMDVLSSQANISGYKAVLLAANLYPRYFPMFMTAAGSIAPAKILILGAGVAGLQAIATARRLQA